MLDFLALLYHQGLGYSALNTARSALASIISLQNNHYIGTHPLVKRFFRGVFLQRPSLPKCGVTWDVSIVLNTLRSMAPSVDLSLLDLSRKLVTLLAILTGQRAQTLHVLNIHNITVSDSWIKLRTGELLKQSRPGYHLPELSLASYPDEPNICVVTLLRLYLNRTHELRGSAGQLFISSQAPHRPVTRSTISRWIKDILRKAGIDLSIFTPHSTRAASTSAALAKNVPLHTILRTAGWSSDCSFRKYYNKPVVQDLNMFSEQLLSFNV